MLFLQPSIALNIMQPPILSAMETVYATQVVEPATAMTRTLEQAVKISIVHNTIWPQIQNVMEMAHVMPPVEPAAAATHTLVMPVKVLISKTKSFIT